MMEHLVDELLEKLSLSRANLIYTGGGHCYMLLPNTDRVRKILKEYEVQINQWLLDFNCNRPMTVQ
jgi:CRISPR-associated protein Csm1